MTPDEAKTLLAEFGGLMRAEGYGAADFLNPMSREDQARLVVVRDAILTALRAAPEGWRPIETAPKSQVEEGGRIVGEYILGFCPDESVIDPKACICVIWWEPLTDGGVWFGEGGFAVRPTLWQPCPEPPR